MSKAFLATSARLFQALTFRDPVLLPARNLKRHVAVHRRCEHCKIVRPRVRLMVECDKHARHNQMQFGRPGQHRVHSVYRWRWPDPFEKKYSYGPFNQDRYMEAFSKD